MEGYKLESEGNVVLLFNTAKVERAKLSRRQLFFAAPLRCVVQQPCMP